jgi:hypothetical protein
MDFLTLALAMLWGWLLKPLAVHCLALAGSELCLSVRFLAWTFQLSLLLRLQRDLELEWLEQQTK